MQFETLHFTQTPLTPLTPLTPFLRTDRHKPQAYRQTEIKNKRQTYDDIKKRQADKKTTKKQTEKKTTKTDSDKTKKHTFT